MEKKTFVDKENWVTYEYWPVNCAVMDFKVYEISRMSLDESELSYPLKGWTSSEDVTEDLSKAETLLDGGIRFDGCINVKFCDVDNFMPHFCGNPANKFKAIFDQLYRFAAELMPDHKDYLLK